MTRVAEAALAYGDPAALRARKRVLDRVSVATLLALFTAALVPWFLQALSLDPAFAARAALAFTLAYWVLAAATDRLSNARGLLVASLVLQAAAVVFLAGMWHLLGGLQTPALLFVFAIPTLAVGILLRPWCAAGCAALAIAAVSLVAMSESSELRWYLSRLGLPHALAGAVSFLPPQPQPFPGVDADPAYAFVVLQGFALSQIACALVVPPLASLLARLRSRPGGAEAVEGQLLEAALRAAFAPTVLVDAQDGRILLASEGFVKRMLLHGHPPAGKTLFEILSFSEPQRIRELLRSPGGTLPLCPYAVGAESRVARVEAQPVVHGGWSYASVRVEDLTELSFLHSAVGGLGEPVLVVGSDGRLRYANRAAEGLFGELFLGLEATEGLGRAGLPEEWWARDGPDRLEIDGTRYEVRSHPVVLDGGAERLRLLSLVRESSAQ